MLVSCTNSFHRTSYYPVEGTLCTVLVCPPLFFLYNIVIPCFSHNDVSGFAFRSSSRHYMTAIYVLLSWPLGAWTTAVRVLYFPCRLRSVQLSFSTSPLAMFQSVEWKWSSFPILFPRRQRISGKQTRSSHWTAGVCIVRQTDDALLL